MAAIVNGAAQLKDFDKSGIMSKRMQQWLDANQAKKDYTYQRLRQFSGKIFSRGRGDCRS